MLATSQTRFSGAPGVQLGSRLAAAGDANGDNFSDLLIGGRSSTQAFLVFGNPGPLGTATLQAGQSGYRTLLQAVYFDFDKSNIKAGERPKLEAAAQYLKDNPTHRVLLEGHCDWRGTAEYNLGLGDRRASAAKQFLSGLGVAADKTETLSKGSLDATKNADDATAAKDRRVELVVIRPL